MRCMERRNDRKRNYGAWARMIAKQQLKNPSFYLLLVGILFLLFLVDHTVLPSAENLKIGVCIGNGAYESRIKNELLSENEDFIFEEAKDETALREAVYQGKYDCGFLFSEDFDEALKKREIDDSITYVFSTSTTKGYVAKECVYAAVFRVLSEELLIEEVQNGGIFEETDENTIETVLSYNEKYRNSDEVFRVLFLADKTEESAEDKEKALPGILAICVFAVSLLYARYRFLGEYESIGKKLRRKERICVLAAHIFIPILILGFLLQFFWTVFFGEVSVKSFLAMFILCLTSTVWSLLFSACFRNEQKYLCSICGVLIVNLMVIPIFFDLSAYFPVIRILRMAFPVSYYLW